LLLAALPRAPVGCEAAGAGEAPKKRQMKIRKNIAYLTTVALMSLVAACSQVEMPMDRAIAFQVASHVASPTKADDYAVDYAAVPFGAYAWFKSENPADNADFMTNEKVAYNTEKNVWTTTSATYYWPRGGKLDFICYSPYSENSGPVVAENSIQWTDWNVSDNPGVDLMYATKAAGLTGPTTTYYYEGVPTLFHHALAQVAVKLRLAYTEKESSTGDKTRWKVTVHSMSLKDVHTHGSLALNLGEGGAWTLPAEGTWTPAGTVASLPLDCSQLPAPLTDETVYEVGTPMFVLPQPLGDANYVDMEVTIETERDTGEGYKPFLTESHVHVSGALASTALPAWGINHRITYTFILAPSLPTDKDGAPVPTEVHFDPAVEGWQEVALNMSINI